MNTITINPAIDKISNKAELFTLMDSANIKYRMLNNPEKASNLKWLHILKTDDKTTVGCIQLMLSDIQKTLGTLEIAEIEDGYFEDKVEFIRLLVDKKY